MSPEEAKLFIGRDGTKCRSPACCLQGRAHSVPTSNREQDGEPSWKEQRRRTGRTALARITVTALLTGSLLAVGTGPAGADELKPRDCDSLVSGDYVRKLDVCARGWVNTGSTVTRGVIEMHTYKWVDHPIPGWVNSTSQSITIESAFNLRNGDLLYYWGQQETQKCRINGPGGSVGCSVPNTYRVAFYSPQMSAPYVDTWETDSYIVSWRDDRGVSHPNRLLAVVSPEWTA
jgi:hypothetical protein